MADSPHEPAALPGPDEGAPRVPAARSEDRAPALPEDGLDEASAPAGGEVARLLARLRGALELALGSGVRAVALDAYGTALECHGALQGRDLPDDVRRALDVFVDDLRERFPTASVLNEALAAVDRAGAATDADAQRAHLAEALAVLDERSGEPGVDAAEVAGLRAQVEDALARADAADAPIEVEVERLAPDAEPAARAERPAQPDLDFPEPPPRAPEVLPRVELSVDAAAQVHATSFARRGAPLVGIAVENADDEPHDRLRLAVHATPPIVLPASVDLPELARGDRLELGPRQLAAFVRYDRARLAGRTEPEEGELVLEVRDARDRVVASLHHPWLVLPDDAWPGLGAAPEGLAAFVLPNDPGIAGYLGATSDLLGASTDSNALDGYQSRDPRRALRMVEAVHGALVGAGITYANPPASFERDGQRVRFPARIAGTRLATCLDLALLAAGMLEAAGLFPLVFLVEGHAFAGAWLVDRSFPAPATDEAGPVRARVDLAELVVFDPTLVTSGGSFEAAREAALERLASPGDLFVAIDVHRARLGGVRPLSTDAGPEVAPDGAPSGSAQAPSRDLDADLEAWLAAERRRALEDETPKGRLDRWLRQLLDLSMRNRLLNAGRTTKRVLPLLSTDGATVEDVLAAGTALTVEPRPAELDGIAQPGPEELAPLAGLFADGAARGRLYAALRGPELAERLLHLYREARTAREEGGSSGLYLTIGTLVYFESPSSETERRAPLLLLPLELKRETARSGFSFVLGEDEPRVNVTLLEALRRDHDIDVTGLEPLPEDESGVDVALVLRLFKDAIKDESRWRVDDTLAIGLYSFAKYLLWRDLVERRDDLVSSDLARHLIERPGEPYEGTADFPTAERLRTAEVFAPLSYDSTQLGAILAAADGATFVLEGPPGTGKSQTITNLIAHAIAHDRSVLFVSEKVAALEVVHDRLVGLGLGPACLELHSAKASKKAVLAQFAEALDAGRQRGAQRRAWDEIGTDLAAAREVLDGHVEALHGEARSGHTLHELVGGLAGADADVEPLPFVLDDPLALGADRLNAWRGALDALDVHGVEQGVGPEHPLLRVGQTETSPLLEASGRRTLLASDAALGAWAAAAEQLVATARPAWGLLGPAGDDPGARPASPEAWRAVLAFGRALAAVTEPFGRGAGAWLAESQLLDDVAADVERVRERATIGARHAQLFRAAPSTLDLVGLEEARRAWVSGGWFARWRKGKVLTRALRGIASDPSASVSPEDAARMLDEVARDVELRAEIERSNAPLASVLGHAWSKAEADGGTLDVAAAEARIAEARRIARHVESVAASTGARRSGVAEAAAARVSGELDTAGLGADLDAFQVAFDAYAAALDDVRSVAAPTERAPDPWNPAVPRAWRDLVRGWADAWPRHRGWTRWAKARAEAVDAGLADVVQLVEEGEATAGTLRPRFERALADALVVHGLSADPRLAAFEGVEHERAIERFRHLDDERLSAARGEVVQRVARRRPTPAEKEAEAPTGRGAPKSGLGLLQRELAKKARHVATRRLLAELGEDALRLKPCFLMSPMSVAQYLAPDHPPFDLVVFDEASQIPVWDAIGAVARGRQAVVVGDPKQLPPTTFFARSNEEEEVPDDEVEDLESILDECIASGVPVRRLAWHYRSRDESLIAFSNERYYDGDLVTFPSSASDKSGVSLRFVEDGVYEKGGSRTNPNEARAVVAEIVRRLIDPEESSSIGVVTFNQAQQSLILDLLEAEAAGRPEVERALAEGTDDGVFVKNLENVQGDERDVIVFSVGYGPDARGRVSMNFGPLNKDGGERRLNVAVTRARLEVVVFTSLRADQIDPSRTSARGVLDLRAFLRYAERGPLSAGAHAEDVGRQRMRDALIDAIADALRARGHVVEKDVGRSAVRVDLAIVDPEDPRRYLLGIETDGVRYARVATARDRDRLRRDVLEGLGWRLHRVWAVDWWRDAAVQVDAIEAALRTE